MGRLMELREPLGIRKAPGKLGLIPEIIEILISGWLQPEAV